MVPLLLILVGLEIGISFFGPVLPQVQRDFNLSAGAVAVALSIYNGIRLAFNIPMSRFVARSRLPVTLAIGGAILAGGALVVSVAPSFAFVLAGRAIMGLGSALFIFAIQFWLARLATPENKAQLFSLHQLAGITGSAVGPALAGIVAGWLSWRYAAALPIAAGLITVLAGLGLPYPSASSVTPSPRAASEGPERVPMREVLGPGLSMMASMIFHSGLIMTLIPLFAARELNLGPAAIGGVLMLGTVQRFGSALVGGRLAARFGTRNTVVYGLAGLGVSVLSFLPVSTGLGLIVAVSIVSWANLGGSFIIAMITDRLPERHWGTALGMNRTLGDAGAMLAPILVGVIADQFSFRVAFAATAVVIVVASGVALMVTAARPQHTPEAAS